jgi:phage-related protein
MRAGSTASCTWPGLRRHVYVLHAFEKRTRQTRKADLELTRRNLAEVVRYRKKR